MKYLQLQHSKHGIKVVGSLDADDMWAAVNSLYRPTDFRSVGSGIMHWCQSEVCYLQVKRRKTITILLNLDMLIGRLKIFYSRPETSWLGIVCLDSSDTELIANCFCEHSITAMRIILTDYSCGWNGCSFEPSMVAVTNRIEPMIVTNRIEPMIDNRFLWLRKVEHSYVKSARGTGGLLLLKLDSLLDFLFELRKGDINIENKW